jgi:hypothetical protein
LDWGQSTFLLALVSVLFSQAIHQASRG